MIVQAKVKLFIPCPSCTAGSWRVDQLFISQTTSGTCQECRELANIKRISENDFEVTPVVGKKDWPVTVTLRSVTVPPITLKLNTWKYSHSQEQSQEEYTDNQRYFYNEHTCPTNWVREIEEIEFQGDRDPHGVFEFVSAKHGHYDSHNPEK